MALNPSLAGDRPPHGRPSPRSGNTVWIFDCDNTLYPAQTGLFAKVDEKIDEFMAMRLGVAERDIPGLRRAYRARYGITLPGLMAEHGADPEEFLEFVHQVPVEEMIAPDPSLAVALERLPGRKVVFTNGSRPYAERILARLGAREAFQAVFDIAFMEYVPKPRPEGYGKLLAALGAAAADCVFADDVVENLDTGKRLGMATVLIGPHPSPGHFHLHTPHGLAALFGDAA